MKKIYEKQKSNTIRDINNLSKQNINQENHIKVNKKHKTQGKSGLFFSNTKNGLNFNYLQQTSSSLNKTRKINSSKKEIIGINNDKNCNIIKVYTLDKKDNINYKQIKKRVDSLLDKEKINIIYQKNYFSDNNDNNKTSTTSQNFFEYFPQPEPFPKTINYNFNINNNLKYKTDYSNSKDSTIGNSCSKNNKEDNNILYLLMNLNLGNLYNIFISNCISFRDLFLLTKDDFVEMKIPIGPRNRIIHFLGEYKKFGKNYDFMELSSFLNYYNQLIEKPFINDEINFSETPQIKKKCLEDNKNNCQNFGDNIKNKGILILNGKYSDSEIKLMNNIKIKENNIHRIKKYNSFNFHNKKENKNKEINYNCIKTGYSKEKSNENKTCLKKRLIKDNSFKNNIINNQKIKKKSNYDFLYQKYKDMDKKVYDFQQNYSKIQKYSKFIDEKISEFLNTEKLI